jgi:hypothetical protein
LELELQLLLQEQEVQQAVPSLADSAEEQPPGEPPELVEQLQAELRGSPVKVSYQARPPP